MSTPLYCKSSPFTNDTCFDDLYPDRIKHLSYLHWTPVDIVREAAGFLAQHPRSRILDIGAGIGKFCLIAAQQYPDCYFIGIEQRRELVSLAEEAKRITAIDNVTFLTGNFQQIDFSHFDHFYFFNSFYENLANKNSWIDDKVEHSLSLYEHYTNSLKKKLMEMPIGTRLATYHSFNEIVPASYKMARNPQDTMLRCWIRS